LKRYVSIVLSAALLLALFCTLSGCARKEPDDAYIARQLGLELPAYTLFSFARDHAGDDDEGFVYGEMTFSEEAGGQLYDKMLSTDTWQVLPLPEKLSLMVYGGSSDGTVYSSYADNMIPEVEHGCYFYKDRSTAGEISKSRERFSNDFIIAIYDSENCALYYYELAK